MNGDLTVEFSADGSNFFRLKLDPVSAPVYS